MRQITLLICAACAGCFGPPSQVQSTDSIVANGQAARQDGSPMAATQVTLIRHPDAFMLLTDAIATIATLGIACLAQRVDICRPFETSHTDAAGSYTFALRGADTQGTGNEALLFSAVIGGPTPPAPAVQPAGVGVDFYMQRTKIDVPALKLWESLGSLDRSSGVRFSWPALDAALGSADSYHVMVTTTDGQTAWMVKTTGATSASIEPRVTEDWAGSWNVAAHHQTSSEGTTWDFTHYSAALSYPSGNEVPISRGRDCFVQGPSGAVKQSPCAVTDGSLGTKFQAVPPPVCPSGQKCTPPPQNGWVYLDLGQVTPLGLLVLYDVATSGNQITVEGSGDASNWSTLASATTAAYQTVPLSGSARYVRLKLASGEFLGSGNGEIAIF